MLEKAESLGSIIPAPSNTPNSFCVRSESNKKSHFVYQLESSGKTICEDCPHWISSSICAHSVAVAEKCGNLKKFIHWRKTQSKEINITKLINYNGAKGVGKKPHQRPRSRVRKSKAPVPAPSSFFDTQIPSCHPYMGCLSPENNQPWQSGKPFYVCRIHGNISRCNGCRGIIDKERAPNDLVIMHEECHYYPHPKTRQMVLSMTPKPKYYHFQLPCLKSKHPTFAFRDLVPGSSGPQLEESHFQLIQHYSHYG